MRLLVFGATGATGGPLTRYALEAGHFVTAVVRRPEKITFSHPLLRVVQGDVLLPGSFAAEVYDQDAVIACLGVNTTKPTTFYSKGVTHLLDAMHRAGVSRLMVMSALGLDIGPEINPVQRFLTKYVLQRILRHPFADLRKMEDIVKASDMEWTIVRPPRLTNGKPKGHYRVAIDRFLARPMVIARADVAGYMLGNVDNSTTYKHTVEIGY
ncbi:NAD(P)-dependent oxidoreductase [Dinghuibacter silviterrae]|uniref:Putative NADH-flavin reductase n=1 Tax=Dinghuibacter silviterrae TaxID=1539049 RepID=A0A4R8DIA7_9BACT|nr:NAD(P)H-binding protein [Dinghuibacter silviterrae]TDW97218.1 putative NADH-flavin reductase [Dinghuibacter silviterrae]